MHSSSQSYGASPAV